MKKFFLLAAMLILTACTSTTPSATPETDVDAEPTTKTFESVAKLSFDYPSEAYGKVVTVQENLGPNGLETEVILSDDTSRLASLSVELIDGPTHTTSTAEHLEAILLRGVENCSVVEREVTDERELYVFQTSVLPFFGDDYDQNCRNLGSIYYFPKSDLDRVVIVGYGHAPPFELEDMNAFIDSIKLTSLR